MTHRTHAQRVDDLERAIACHPPRPAQGGRAAAGALVRAASLACLIRDEDTASIGAYLDDLDRGQLYALVVALAATVDPGEVLEDRLGWVADLGRDLERHSQRVA